MIWLIKRLLCGHKKLLFCRNIYGDEIIEKGYSRSIWQCASCGKVIYSKELSE